MKKINKYIRAFFYLILFTVFFMYEPCCGAGLNNDKPMQDSGSIIIIQNFLERGLQIEYRNQFNDTRLLYPNDDGDTIKLADVNFIPLRIHYKKDNIMFPLQKGDSLVVKLNHDGKLELSVINDKKKEFDTLFLKFCNNRMHQEYEELRKWQFPDSAFKPNNPKAYVVKRNVQNNNQYYSELFDKSKKINDTEWKILDSLFNENKISDEYIYVYGALINSAFINNVIQCYSETKSAKYRNYIISSQRLFNPLFLKFDAGRYKDVLNSYIENIIANGKFHKYGLNAITIDYKNAFDSAPKYFHDELLDYVKFICLKNIRQQSTTAEYQKYFSNFSQRTKDASYIHYFNQEYYNEGLEQDMLYTFKGFKKTGTPLNELFKQYPGEIIFIDLWASWCAPCRAAMPALQKVKNQFSVKGVRFVYISLDENIANWKNAALLEGLSQYPDSYLLSNPKSSAFLKKLKIADIPRYIITNKKKKIIKVNAPPPGSKELVKVLNELLE